MFPTSASGEADVAAGGQGGTLHLAAASSNVVTREEMTLPMRSSSGGTYL
jgi:hypothetical protein